jgi:hypothetical protein
MDILITEVTEMHRGNYCVAGWDFASARMIRPLPDGYNWSAELIARHRVAPGATIRITPRGTPLARYPHRTEDTPIDISNIANVDREFNEWTGPAAPPTALDIDTGFGCHILFNNEWRGARQGVHVLVGTRCSSLAAIRIQRRRLSFFVEFDKLRAILHDGTARFRLPVSGRALNEAWRQGGLPAVRKTLPTRDIFCVRLGLTRPFGNPPDKCYLMINGVL